MRPAIEIDRAFVLVRTNVRMEGDDALRGGVVVSPDAQRCETAERVVG